MHKTKKRGGFSLIELVVAMGIFLVVITLAVGAFVTVSRMKALTSTMKDVQQKTRISMEMITRLSRQADRVIVSGDKKTLELYFNLKDPSTDYGNKFEITSDGVLNMYECPNAPGGVCSVWSTPLDLLGGSISLNYEASSFNKLGTIPPQLNIILEGATDTIDSAYFSNDLVIDTTIILENVK